MAAYRGAEVAIQEMCQTTPHSATGTGLQADRLPYAQVDQRRCAGVCYGQDRQGDQPERTFSVVCQRIAKRTTSFENCCRQGAAGAVTMITNSYEIGIKDVYRDAHTVVD